VGEKGGVSGSICRTHPSGEGPGFLFIGVFQVQVREYLLTGEEGEISHCSGGRNPMGKETWG